MRIRLITAGIFLGIALPSAAIHLYLQAVHRDTFDRQVSLITRSLGDALSEQIGLRLDLVASMAREVEGGTLTPGDRFAARALELQRRFPGYQALNLTSPEGIIEQVVPVEPNRGALKRDIKQHPVAGRTFKEAQATGLPQITDPLKLFQGGAGFATYFPIEQGRRGFVNGVFRLGPMVDQLIDASVYQDFAVHLTFQGEPMHTAGAPGPYTDRQWGHKFKLMERQWSVRLAPTQAYENAFSSLTPLGVLLTGLIGAVLIAWLVFRGLISRQRRQLMEARLLQSRRMEALGTLAGGVAHDFNNLLTLINGTLELSLEEIEPDTVLHDDLSTLLTSSRQAATLTAQLMAFARHRVERDEIFHPDEAVEGATRLLKRLLTEAIEMTVDLSADRAALKGDPGAFQQMIVNLALNARDAMPEGGHLHIETGRGQREGVACVEIRVTDSGIGMSPEVQERIFDPFFTTKGRGEGTGLGLAMVYRTVQSLDGDIKVRSRLGEGTTFILEIPAQQGGEAVDASRTATQAIARSSRPLRVLLAEDDAGIRENLTRALRRAGHSVISVADGQIALEHLKQPLDLLVTDVVMPNLGGVELAHRFRALHPDNPVIFCTGYADQALPVDEDPRMSVLLKPFPLTRLVQTVEQAGANLPLDKMVHSG